LPPTFAVTRRSTSAVDGTSSVRTPPSSDRLPSGAAYKAPGSTENPGSEARSLNENQPLALSPILAKSNTALYVTPGLSGTDGRKSALEPSALHDTVPGMAGSKLNGLASARVAASLPEPSTTLMSAKRDTIPSLWATTKSGSGARSPKPAAPGKRAQDDRLASAAIESAAMTVRTVAALAEKRRILGKRLILFSY